MAASSWKENKVRPLLNHYMKYTDWMAIEMPVTLVSLKQHTLLNDSNVEMAIAI